MLSINPAEEGLGAAELLAQASARLLRSAQGTLREGMVRSQGEAAPAALSEFVQIYREWITLERGELGTQQQQADQWQMLVHCMINAPGIQDAIAQFLHFSRVVWGDRAPTALREEGDVSALVFNEPQRPGAEGLVAAIWMLSLILSTLEFLANARFVGASGRVMHDPCLPDGVARMLFDAPVAYGQGDVALLIPRQHLRRPVIARAADLPQFFRQLLPLTLGAARTMPAMAAMVTGLIRDQTLGAANWDGSRDHVAAMLGMSEATMRRRLKAEGVTFRQLRDACYNTLAMEWLASGDVSISTIAARLGFSDAFAFRRFFRRHNTLPPSAFRQRQMGNGGSGG